MHHFRRLRHKAPGWLIVAVISAVGGSCVPLHRETEIARIELKSVTADVISIRAQAIGEDKIGYRAVDEYETEFSIDPEESHNPLSLEELIQLIDGVNEGGGGGLALCYNQSHFECGTDAESMRHFTTVKSDFYGGIHLHYEQVYDEWVKEAAATLSST